MPINQLTLEIDDQLMTENYVTFNMIEFHNLPVSSIFINCIDEMYVFSSIVPNCIIICSEYNVIEKRGKVCASVQDT